MSLLLDLHYANLIGFQAALVETQSKAPTKRPIVVKLSSPDITQTKLIAYKPITGASILHKIRMQHTLYRCPKIFLLLKPTQA